MKRTSKFEKKRERQRKRSKGDRKEKGREGQEGRVKERERERTVKSSITLEIEKILQPDLILGLGTIRERVKRRRGRNE